MSELPPGPIMIMSPRREGIALIGGRKPWDPTLWTAVDDRVRGGASQSHFSVPKPQTGHFHGTLDITALGGAGFASQKAVFSSPLNLTAWDGIMVNIAGGNSKTYTLILKDAEDLPKRPDGRLQSTVSWEYDFVVKGEGGGAHFAPFGEFRPTYRGRPKEDAEPLDSGRVRSLSVMIRSHFGEQKGEIDLSMRFIGVYRDGEGCTKSDSVSSLGKGDVDEKGGHTTASGRGSWFDCFLGMFGGRR